MGNKPNTVSTEPKFPKASSKDINLTVDTTFFSGRNGFGVVDCKAEAKHIYWHFCQRESLAEYSIALNYLDQHYNLLSVTIDGKRGLRQMIERRYAYSVVVQYCQFHQVATVTRYTTKKPKTDCGQDLRSLILQLKDLSKQEFTELFKQFQNKQEDFLKERSEINPKEYKHQNLRKAVRSIKTNLPYLFTFEDYPQLNIPKTTNSCDGGFGQWKKKVKLHNGISKERKQQMINQLLRSK